MLNIVNKCRMLLRKWFNVNKNHEEMVKYSDTHYTNLSNWCYNTGIKLNDGGTRMVSLQALSNTILEKSFSEKIPVSPMKLQKLLYFIYKEYAQRTGIPLFSEEFQAWDYGPVVQSIYDEFKAFKAGSITRFAKDATDKVYILNRSKVGDVFEVIDDIWTLYKCRTGIELSQITHRVDSAWYKAYTAGKPLLKFEDIVHDRTDKCSCG